MGAAERNVIRQSNGYHKEESVQQSVQQSSDFDFLIKQRRKIRVERIAARDSSGNCHRQDIGQGKLVYLLYYKKKNIYICTL